MCVPILHGLLCGIYWQYIGTVTKQMKEHNPSSLGSDTLNLKSNLSLENAIDDTNMVS